MKNQVGNRSNIQELEPIISEKRVREEGNVFVAVIVAILLVVMGLLFIFGFEFTSSQLIFFLALIVAFYIIVLSFLFEPKKVVEVIKRMVRTETVERHRIIEKPVIRTIERPVEIEKPVKKPEKPKFKYIGSTQTKTYHKSSCRLGRLIKDKYKLESNDVDFFIKKKFKPGKACFKLTKRQRKMKR